MLGLLNSKAIGYWISNTGDKSKQTLFPRITMAALKRIPIPTSSPEDRKSISEIAAKIIAAKKENPMADMSTLEAKIDQSVYKMYNLTPHDTAVIESATNSASKEVQKAKGRRIIKPQSESVLTDDEGLD